jgi:hypothetical protein
MRNQADYTVTNIVSKGYQVYASTSEDRVLRQVSDLGYNYAVVFSTGTEFINGTAFFDAILELIKQEFFIAGHVLDRKDAYYELHHQCYVVNLEKYKELGCPDVGQQELGQKHTQYAPMRSVANIHDDYTPTTVVCGFTKKDYSHKCHGWNILSKAFEIDQVQVFGHNIRHNKRHFYPENPTEFLKHVSWAYKRQAYCQNDFVHTESTDTNLPLLPGVTQLFVPASGLAWQTVSSNIEVVVIYDYNQQALDYWKDHVPPNITYKFVRLDLLHDEIDIAEYLDPSKKTFVNLSNVFAYEGTAFFTSVEYRKYKEQLLIDKIKTNIPDVVIYSSVTAGMGITLDLPWHTYD